MSSRVSVELIDSAIHHVEGDIERLALEQRAPKLWEAINNILPDRFAALRPHVYFPRVEVTANGSVSPGAAQGGGVDAGGAPAPGRQDDERRRGGSPEEAGGASDGDREPAGGVAVPVADLMAVWRSVNAHRLSTPFRKPVPAKEAASYNKVVKQPMDLQKLKQRVEQGVVTSYDAFLRDVLLIASNAALYNGAESEYAEWAGEVVEHTKRRIGEQLEANTGGMQSLPPRRAARRARSKIKQEDAAGGRGGEESGQEEHGDGEAGRNTGARTRRIRAGGEWDRGVDGYESDRAGYADGGEEGGHGEENDDEEADEGEAEDEAGEGSEEGEEEEGEEEAEEEGGGREQRGKGRQGSGGAAASTPQTRGLRAQQRKGAQTAPVATRARTRKRRRGD